MNLRLLKLKAPVRPVVENLMNTNTQDKPIPLTLKQKAIEEVKEAFALTIYFGTWFCALSFLAATILDERPIPLSMFGFAIIKAAFCAKFLLIGQAIFPIKVKVGHGILRSLLIESLVYLVIVLALNYLEAGVRGLFDGKEFLISMTEFGNSNPLKVVAMSIVYWLIVWPYLVFMGMELAMGSKFTSALLFGRKK